LPAAALALIIFATLGAAESRDQGQTTSATGQRDSIHVVADTLSANSEARLAEFSGNVRATQGDTVITADRLKIFYSESAAPAGNSSATENAVKRIVASGNVRVTFDNRVATAAEAVYNNESKVVVLSGTPAKIVSGTDAIMGEKITYSRSDGRITVESGRNSRVEALIHSPDGGLR